MLNFTACEWKLEGVGKPFAITGRASYGEYRIDLSSGSDKKEIDNVRRIEVHNDIENEKLKFFFDFNFSNMEYNSKKLYEIKFICFSSLPFYDETKQEEIIFEKNEEYDYSRPIKFCEDKLISLDYKNASEERKGDYLNNRFGFIRIAEMEHCPGATSGGRIYIKGAKESDET